MLFAKRPAGDSGRRREGLGQTIQCYFHATVTAAFIRDPRTVRGQTLLTRPRPRAFATSGGKRIGSIFAAAWKRPIAELETREGRVTVNRAQVEILRRASRISRRFVIAASGAVALPHIARAADTLSVKLDFFPWGMHAGIHLAAVNGWFKEAALDVTTEDGRGSANALQLVNAGQFDVGQIQVGLLSQAAASGARLKAFAGFMRATDLACTVPEESTLHTVADMRGKSLVCFGASPWMPFVDLWLKVGGLTRDDVNLMLVDPAALFGTYTSGRADALLSPVGAALPVARKGRPSRPIMASDAGIFFPSYGLVATDAVLQSKRDALRRLVQTQQRAWAWLADNHLDDGVAAAQKQRPDSRIDPDIFREQIRICLTLFNTPNTADKPIGWQSQADWDACIATQIAAGVVKPGLQSSDFFTNDMIA
jgi:NitT/TauT family transport system substrate-binding protein